MSGRTGLSLGQRFASAASAWDSSNQKPLWLESSNETTSQEKTLGSGQNLENKGPEIFLPPRSMVLKVVTGKI
jgi:hypothetical protein